MKYSMYIMAALSTVLFMFLLIAVGYSIGWESGRPKIDPDEVIPPVTDTIAQPPLCEPPHDYFQPPHNVLP